jgi:hypothetical protein
MMALRILQNNKISEGKNRQEQRKNPRTDKVDSWERMGISELNARLGFVAHRRKVLPKYRF